MTNDVTSHLDEPNLEFDRLLGESLERSFSPPHATDAAERILECALCDDDSSLRINDTEIKSTNTPTLAPGTTDLSRLTMSRLPDPVRRAVAVAAVMLGLAGSYMIWNYFNSAGPNNNNPYQQFHRKPGQIYAAAANGSEPFWVCKDERQFITTFWQRLGYGAKLKSPLPDGTVALGLSYADSVSKNSILLGGTYQRTEPVVVIIDRLDADAASDTTGPKNEKPDPATGLKMYRREAPPLVLYEISKLDHPLLINSIEPAEMPEEWIPGHGRTEFNPPPPDNNLNNNNGTNEGGN